MNFLEKESIIIKEKLISYFLYIPDNYKTEEKNPMIVFLHGAGDKRKGLSNVLKYRNLPFVVLCPHLNTNNNLEDVNNLIEHAILRYNIDRHRIYLTGWSMGGFYSLLLASHYPIFAAIAVLSGYGGWGVEWGNLVNVPIFFAHGEKDNTIPIEEMESLVSILKRQNNFIKVKKYANRGHAIWQDVYVDELFDWFLSYKKD